MALAEVIGSDLAAYPNVRAWLGRMKALKSWPKVWSVIDGFAETLKAQADGGRLIARIASQEHAMIRKLHHNAYRCRDSEETRRFYEDFLGLPLVQAFEIGRTKTGRETHALHTFYRLDDGSHLAFFEAPDMPFEFKPQHDFDLHIALEVGAEALPPMMAKGESAGPRMPRPVGPRHDRLDLLPRPERLRDRALRQAGRARRADGPGDATARATRCSAGRRARRRSPPEPHARSEGGGMIGRDRIRPWSTA